VAVAATSLYAHAPACLSGRCMRVPDGRLLFAHSQLFCLLMARFCLESAAALYVAVCRRQGVYIVGLAPVTMGLQVSSASDSMP